MENKNTEKYNRIAFFVIYISYKNICNSIVRVCVCVYNISGQDCSDEAIIE